MVPRNTASIQNEFEQSFPKKDYRSDEFVKSKNRGTVFYLNNENTMSNTEFDIYSSTSDMLQCVAEILMLSD